MQRLVRDGVDSPLGDLFANIALPAESDSADVDEPCNASEEFLFRRLETLKETRGRFRLKDRLPIAFYGANTLEVDLLCPDAQLAIELDELHNLANIDVYRRDRRKDHVLQVHGYLVLRFLTEDIATDLDRVLDAILQALLRK
jgi:very-short-patch-repair endonuclease